MTDIEARLKEIEDGLSVIAHPALRSSFDGISLLALYEKDVPFLLDTIRKLLKEREWRPISEAPKDGTWIQVYWPRMSMGQYPLIVFWDEGWFPARHSDRDYGEVYPTYFKPLSQPPKGDE